MSIPPNLPPAAIARQALEDLPLAERRRLLRLHMQGVDTAPLVQKDIEEIIAEFNQKVFEFSLRTLENMRRITLVSSRLANDFQGIRYLEGIKIQIETLANGIDEMEAVEDGLSEAVARSKEVIRVRHNKIRELTEILIAFNQTLRKGDSSTPLNIVYGIGDKMVHYVVNMPDSRQPGSRYPSGGSHFPK